MKFLQQAMQYVLDFTWKERVAEKSLKRNDIEFGNSVARDISYGTATVACFSFSLVVFSCASLLDSKEASETIGRSATLNMKCKTFRENESFLPFFSSCTDASHF